MSLIKQNSEITPWKNLLTDLFEGNSLRGSELTNWKSIFTSSMPSANVREYDNEFNIEIAIPGYKREDFKINVENNLLKISGNRKDEKQEDNKTYTRREFNYDCFERSFTLPANVEKKSIKAEYKNGMLSITIPKAELHAEQEKNEIIVQ